MKNIPWHIAKITKQRTLRDWQIWSVVWFVPLSDVKGRISQRYIGWNGGRMVCLEVKDLRGPLLSGSCFEYAAKKNIMYGNEMMKACEHLDIALSSHHRLQLEAAKAERAAA